MTTPNARRGGDDDLARKLVGHLLETTSLSKMDAEFVEQGISIALAQARAEERERCAKDLEKRAHMDNAMDAFEMAAFIRAVDPAD